MLAAAGGAGHRWPAVPALATVVAGVLATVVGAIRLPAMGHASGADHGGSRRTAVATNAYPQVAMVVSGRAVATARVGHVGASAVDRWPRACAVAHDLPVRA